MKKAKLKAAFEKLEAAAVAGERCPTNAELGEDYSVVFKLAREGRVLSEIYAQNFRRVTILTGPNKGKKTVDPPDPAWRPYKIVGRTTENRYASQEQCTQPSAPRLIGDYRV